MKFEIKKSNRIFAINMLTPLPVEQRAQGELFIFLGYE
jgi:hypothetical protein